jgi:hypothetical protein
MDKLSFYPPFKDSMKTQTKLLQGPYNFNQREVFFDAAKGEFWDPKHHQYLDHEIGLALIELYFGHHKAPIEVKKDSAKVKKKWLKKLLEKQSADTKSKKSH